MKLPCDQRLRSTRSVPYAGESARARLPTYTRLDCAGRPIGQSNLPEVRPLELESADLACQQPHFNGHARTRGIRVWDESVNRYIPVPS